MSSSPTNLHPELPYDSGYESSDGAIKPRSKSRSGRRSNSKSRPTEPGRSGRTRRERTKAATKSTLPSESGWAKSDYTSPETQQEFATYLKYDMLNGRKMDEATTQYAQRILYETLGRDKGDKLASKYFGRVNALDDTAMSNVDATTKKTIDDFATTLKKVNSSLHGDDKTRERYMKLFDNYTKKNLKYWQRRGTTGTGTRPDTGASIATAHTADTSVAEKTKAERRKARRAAKATDDTTTPQQTDRGRSRSRSKPKPRNRSGSTSVDESVISTTPGYNTTEGTKGGRKRRGRLSATRRDDTTSRSASGDSIPADWKSTKKGKSKPRSKSAASKSGLKSKPKDKAWTTGGSDSTYEPRSKEAWTTQGSDSTYNPKSKKSKRNGTRKSRKAEKRAAKKARKADRSTTATNQYELGGNYSFWDDMTRDVDTWDGPSMDNTDRRSGQSESYYDTSHSMTNAGMAYQRPGRPQYPIALTSGKLTMGTASQFGPTNYGGVMNQMLGSGHYAPNSTNAIQPGTRQTETRQYGDHTVVYETFQDEDGANVTKSTYVSNHVPPRSMATGFDTQGYGGYPTNPTMSYGGMTGHGTMGGYMSRPMASAY